MHHRRDNGRSSKKLDVAAPALSLTVHAPSFVPASSGSKPGPGPSSAQPAASSTAQLKQGPGSFTSKAVSAAPFVPTPAAGAGKVGPDAKPGLSAGVVAAPAFVPTGIAAAAKPAAAQPAATAAAQPSGGSSSSSALTTNGGAAAFTPRMSHAAASFVPMAPDPPPKRTLTPPLPSKPAAQPTVAKATPLKGVASPSKPKGRVVRHEGAPAEAASSSGLAPATGPAAYEASGPSNLSAPSHVPPQPPARSPVKLVGPIGAASPGRGRGRGAWSDVRGRGFKGGGGGGGGGPGLGLGSSYMHAPGASSSSYHAPNGPRLQQAVRYMAEAARQQLQQHNFLVQAQWHSDSDEFAVPEKVQHYHTLYPLEDLAVASDQVSTALGVRSSVYKAISAHDGLPYVLRHVNGKQVIPTSELLASARAAVESWSVVAYHPNLIALRGAFVSYEIDKTASLFFVHDYAAGALSLSQVHLQPSSTPSGLVRNPASEEQLWSYLVQLTSAIRAVHSNGLALRSSSLDPSKVLITSFGRLRIGAVGILDTLSGETALREDVGPVQREDLVAVGQLLLSLACSSAQSSSVPSLEYCAAHYSPELARIIAALLGSTDGGGLLTWRHLCSALGERMMTELDTLSMANEAMCHDLGREIENGRLLRMMVKLGFINERPEGDVATSQWAETGDRYLLKLFRDFVFHQVNEDGAPSLDWGHVMECLNKLDAGVSEKVLLLSRDEMSMLVVSYSDIKRCIEGAYNELKAQAAPVVMSRLRGKHLG